jgi:hypothetical protein
MRDDSRSLTLLRREGLLERLTDTASRLARLQPCNGPVGVERDDDRARPLGPHDGYLFEVESALSGKRRRIVASIPAQRVVVENTTGRALHVPGCWRLFQVALVSSTHRPAVAWLTCLQTFTIPAGQSSYPATVQASYSQCTPGRPRGGVRAAGGHPRFLPAITTPGSSKTTISFEFRRH